MNQTIPDQIFLITYPNELSLIERLKLCPGEPYRSEWLFNSSETKPKQVKSTSTQKPTSLHTTTSI